MLMKKAMRFSLLLAFVVSFAAALPMRAAAQQQSPDVHPPKLAFTAHTLSNGLQLILLEEHSVPVIDLQVWYHVGSKDERPGRTGFAHLFEHLMFKGSAHVGPDEHSRIIEAVGGFDNAETNDDTTNFFETFPSNGSRPTAWAASTWTRRISSLNARWSKKSGACGSITSRTGL
jgi:zinc protease